MPSKSEEAGDSTERVPSSVKLALAFAVGALVGVAIGVPWGDWFPIDQDQATHIAYEQLTRAADDLLKYYSVDKGRLPPPTIELGRNGKTVLYDFKDPAQDIRIVISVEPSGHSELSLTRISGRED
jgi:hypothetical protein